MAKKNKKLLSLRNGLVDALDLPVNSTGWNGGILNSLQPLYNNISQRILSLEPMTLTYAYKTFGLLQTAIDQPIYDAFRGGVQISSATLSAEEIDQLEKKMEEEGDWEVIQDVLRWESLFGGGILIANTDQDPAKILSERRIIDGNLRFIASDRWECVSQNTNLDPRTTNFEYHGQVIDNSRTRVLTGKNSPYYLRQRLQGWGLSEFEASIPPLTQYLKSMNVVLELLDEAKIDILKIDGLSQTLAQADGSRKIKQRVDVAAANKNYKSMIAMDAKDAYEQKTLTFGGLSDIAKEIRIQLSAYLRRPVSKLWGVGSSGFSSGEDDLENYNSVVEDKRHSGLRLARWEVDLRCLQLFGRKVPDIEFKCKPLRVVSATDEQMIDNQKVANTLQMINGKVLTPRQGATALVKDEIINLSEDELQNVPDEYQESEYQGDLFETITK